MQLLLGLDGEDRYRTGGYCRFLDIVPIFDRFTVYIFLYFSATLN